MNAAADAFEGMADDYDKRFTRTLIGATLRAAVWRRYAAHFCSGSRVLEMNCGTGEDALWLARRGVQVLATDISPAMLRIAERKLLASPGCAPVQFQRLAWEELGGLDAPLMDGALSNFGGLNCVADLPGAARALALKLRCGAVAVLCIMGPKVPWEWLWFLVQGRADKAFRRLRADGTEWAGTRIYYPSIAESQSAFLPHFRLLKICAVGALVPPPYAERWAQGAPRVIAALDRVERRLESFWPLPQFADHYVLELERV